MKKKYSLIDSGDSHKLEEYGPYIIIRPSQLAVWKPSSPKNLWDKADFIFSRDKKNHWIYKKKNITPWIIELEGLKFKVFPNDFGNLGIFPEHSLIWKWMGKKIINKKSKILNLFAYTGAATIAAAKCGAEVCHLDASKPMVMLAKENAKLNNLQTAPIRWIIDDVMKFLKREIKRKSKYDGIIVDPPTFGRGPKGEVFKVEKDIYMLLEMCEQLLAKTTSFLIFSCHTPGFNDTVMTQIMKQIMRKRKGKILSQEIKLSAENDLPMGYFVRWEND